LEAERVRSLFLWDIAFCHWLLLLNILGLCL
jgi:hypothetical protein